jgi:hypothetical protein
MAQHSCPTLVHVLIFRIGLFKNRPRLVTLYYERVAPRGMVLRGAAVPYENVNSCPGQDGQDFSDRKVRMKTRVMVASTEERVEKSSEQSAIPGEHGQQSKTAFVEEQRRRARHPLKPSKELLEAYAKADAMHRAKRVKQMAAKTRSLSYQLADGIALDFLVKLLAALIFAAVFVWLVATAISSLPQL